MSKLTACPRCPGFVPLRATLCPHCDAPLAPPGRASTLLWLTQRLAQVAAGGAVAVTLMACYGAAAQHKIEQGPPPPPSTPAEVADDAPARATDDAPARATDDAPARATDDAPAKTADEVPAKAADEVPADDDATSGQPLAPVGQPN